MWPLNPGQIGGLQATQMTHEAAIRDLESEKSRLKDKVLRLEEDRGALQNKSQALDERQRQQIFTLEKVLSIASLHHSPIIIINMRGERWPSSVLCSRALSRVVPFQEKSMIQKSTAESCVFLFFSKMIFFKTLLQCYYSAIDNYYNAMDNYLPPS